MEDGGLELQKEWRQIVLNKLDTLERGQKAVEDKLINFTMNAAKLDEFHRLEIRVRDLEETKIKALAIWALVQGLSVAAAWIISLLLKNS